MLGNITIINTKATIDLPLSNSISDYTFLLFTSAAYTDGTFSVVPYGAELLNMTTSSNIESNSVISYYAPAAGYRHSCTFTYVDDTNLTAKLSVNSDTLNIYVYGVK